MAIQNSVPGRMSMLDSQYGQMRTGTVLVVNAFAAQVEVGGTRVLASFLRTLTPKVGDVVSIIRQDATWMIMGSISSGGPDPVQNGSFEGATESGWPVGWRLYPISGTSNLIVVEEATAPAGTHVAEVSPEGGPNAESYLYSPPWSVVQGEQWTIAAYARRYWPLAGSPPLVSAAVYATWFANASDTMVDSIGTPSGSDFVTLTDEWVGISHTATVPGGGVNFMRLALRSATIGGAGVQWDTASARRTG